MNYRNRLNKNIFLNEFFLSKILNRLLYTTKLDVYHRNTNFCDEIKSSDTTHAIKMKHHNLKYNLYSS